MLGEVAVQTERVMALGQQSLSESSGFDLGLAEDKLPFYPLLLEDAPQNDLIK